MHTTRTGRRRLSGRVRAVLSLGMLLGIAQVGTLASWSDTATVQTGTFGTGTLDMRVGEVAADQLSGQGGTWTHSGLTLTTMAPGESVAQLLTVGNTANTNFTYNGTVATTNGTLSGANGLQLTIVKDATDVTNSGAHANNDRVGGCVGGTPTSVTNTGVGTAPVTINAAPISLTSGVKTTYCVLATLPADAPNAMQGQSTNIVFNFQADQS